MIAKTHAERQQAYRDRQKRHVTDAYRNIRILKAEIESLRDRVTQLEKTSRDIPQTPFSIESPSEISFLEKTPSMFPPRGESNGVAFDRWWENYPNKVGKGAARKAFTKALTKTSLDQLMDGLDAYKRTKPADREWCNPATWLNQERWLDKPAVNGHIISVTRGPPAPLTDEQRARIMGRLPN